jgi:RimJ/RimL family protein N-acetyltransferase
MDLDMDIEMDPAFLERDAQRKAGQPVKIAETERLLLRESILSDTPIFYENRARTGGNREVMQMQPSLSEEMEFMDAYIRNAYAFYDYGLWTVLEKESGRIIGRAGLQPSEILKDAVELGYMIIPNYQHRGYAVECGLAILQYAHEVLDMEEIHLLTDDWNEASIRTAERLGFQKTESIHTNNRKLLHFRWRA